MSAGVIPAAAKDTFATLEQLPSQSCCSIDCVFFLRFAALSPSVLMNCGYFPIQSLVRFGLYLLPLPYPLSYTLSPFSTVSTFLFCTAFILCFPRFGLVLLAFTIVCFCCLQFLPFIFTRFASLRSILAYARILGRVYCMPYHWTLLFAYTLSFPPSYIPFIFSPDSISECCLSFIQCFPGSYQSF